MAVNEGLYAFPEIYELAFSFRDYPDAVNFLTAAAKRAGLGEIRSMVEYGCGPGQYCLEFARRGIRSFGIDNAPEMVLYASEIADSENLLCEIVEGDMRSTRLPQPVDLACCMMATFTYLLTNEDIATHFRTVAESLTSGGVYIIELPHPKGLFTNEDMTHDRWEMEGKGVKLTTDWGSDAHFDAITEIDTGTVRFEWEQDGRTHTHEAVDRTRRMAGGLIDALVELSGVFEIVDRYGDLDPDQPYDNSKKSWRLVTVLRKR